MKLLRTLFGCYAAVVFGITLLIVFPLYILIFSLGGRNKAPRLAHSVSRLWALILFRLFLIRYEIINSHLVDKHQTYVFVANHRSMLDIPLYARSCTNTFRFLSKAELTRIPLLGYVIKRLYITVKRGNKQDSHRSIEVMRKSIDEHISVFLCPEGTRNTTQQVLLPFKDGAFRLAIATQTPLAVLTVIHTDNLLSPLAPLSLKPGKIIAEWSTPINTQGMTENDVESLKQKAADLMSATWIKHKKTG